eukprot:1159809-Pelagomonas_calceolata.AAC.5
MAACTNSLVLWMQAILSHPFDCPNVFTQAPPSAYGSPHKQPCAVDASTDSLQPLNGLRSPTSPSKCVVSV